MGTVTFTSKDRQALVDHPDSRIVRKRARTVARRMETDFVVHTDHGIIVGKAGDFLATNHPADDPTSDIWPISAERFGESYEAIEA